MCFELQSETNGPRINETAVRLARNWFAGNLRLDMRPSREGRDVQARCLRSLKAALWLVLSRLSVAYRLSWAWMEFTQNATVTKTNQKGT